MSDSTNITEFFENLKTGAKWDVGVSINRSNALPLDANSVFASLSAAEKYAAGTPEAGTLANAYPGQVLAVVTDTDATIYMIDAKKELQPLAKGKDVEDLADIVNGTAAVGNEGDADYVPATLGLVGEVAALKTAVGNLNHLTTELVESTDKMTEEGVLYLLQVADATGDDVYQEYLVLNGTPTLIGDTTTNLSNYHNKDEIAELLAGKAEKGTTLAEYGITDAYTATQTDEAIRAKIEEITGGDTAGDVLGLLNDYRAANDREIWGEEFVTNATKDGKYEPTYSSSTSRIDALEELLAGISTTETKKTVVEYINEAIEAASPSIATSESVGLVKASDEVNVAEDGTLSIGEISTDKLVQGQNILVLNGGDAGASAEEPEEPVVTE